MSDSELNSPDDIAEAQLLQSSDVRRASGASVDADDIAHQLEVENISTQSASAHGASPRAHDPYGALRIRDYRFYAIGSFLAALTTQMLDVAIAWEITERVARIHGSANAALALGYVGLVLALPVILFALPAGHIADKYDRRGIALISLGVSALVALALAAISHFHAPISWVYVCLFFFGTAGALRGPAVSAILPQLVPDELLSNAVTWNSSRFQTAAMVGPAIGGLLIAATHNYAMVYVLDALGLLVFMAFMFAIRPRLRVEHKEPVSWQNLLAGIAFVRSSKLILATITLDMFAVLLGGATMLLPIFARDILQVGAAELGWLRAAPAVGALLMGLALAHLPPMQHAGKALLLAVVGFGLATIGFGFSKSFWFSMLMLFLTGAFDNISVVVRHTLVQVLTPDNMRGRVSAVNSVFIGSSNQLGGFESGLAAKFFGPVASVVGGGIGTILVVTAIALKWPEVRRLRTLESARA